MESPNFHNLRWRHPRRSLYMKNTEAVRDCGSVGLRDGGSVDGGSVAAWDYGIMGSILKYYNYYDYVLTKLLLICN